MCVIIRALVSPAYDGRLSDDSRCVLDHFDV